jgi:hypothetical protein
MNAEECTPVMRWSYKTVVYELKKEGFLGSAFLDEAEVEESLNEYGKNGWELVSMMEMQDGLIAVFKRPLAEKKGDDSLIQNGATNMYFSQVDDDMILTEDDIVTEEPVSHFENESDDFDEIRIE